MVEVEKRGRVAFIHLNDARHKNVLTAETMQQLMQALDEAETYDDVTCLVTTGVGKVYSTGLDISTKSPSTHNWDKIAHDMTILQKLLARLLTFPMPTVAAMNGHAFGGGGLLALAHDYRIMHSDRGWFCIPLARLQLPPIAGIISLLKAKVSPHVLSQVMLAKLFTGPEAEAAGIVDETCPLAELRDRAIAAATRLAGEGGLDRKTLQTLKKYIYADTIKVLSNELTFSIKSKL